MLLPSPASLAFPSLLCSVLSLRQIYERACGMKEGWNEGRKEREQIGREHNIVFASSVAWKLLAVRVLSLRSMIAKSILSTILVRCTHDLLGVASCLRAVKALGALFACTMRSSPSRGPGRNGTRRVSTCPASLLSDASIGLDAPNQIPEATFATLSLWIC